MSVRSYGHATPANLTQEHHAFQKAEKGFILMRKASARHGAKQP
jgi:hypothetical protein